MPHQKNKTESKKIELPKEANTFNSIVKKILAAGFRPHTRVDTTGIVIGINILDSFAICGYLPIDVRDHNSFAEFLINKARKLSLELEHATPEEIEKRKKEINLEYGSIKELEKH